MAISMAATTLTSCRSEKRWECWEEMVRVLSHLWLYEMPRYAHWLVCFFFWCG